MGKEPPEVLKLVPPRPGHAEVQGVGPLLHLLPGEGEDALGSLAKSISRKRLLPVALSLSPTRKRLASCLRDTAWYKEATWGGKLSGLGFGASPFTASATFLMCSGPVPQHPPTAFTPYSATNLRCHLASSSGVRS